MIFKPFSNIIKIIGSGYRLQFIFLGLLLFIGMFMEAFGIALLVPLLDFISKPNSSDFSILFSTLNIFFKVESKEKLISIFLVFMILVYILKSIYIIFLHHKQNLFLSKLHSNISVKLYWIYINQPFSFFSKVNSTDLHKRLSNDTSYFNNYVSSYISLITEIGFIFSLTFSVIYLEPFASSVMGISLFIISFLYFRFSRLKMKKWGLSRNKIEVKLSKASLESFKGIKEIMVYQKKTFFYNLFKTNKNEFTKIQAKFKTLSIVPRYFIELISIIIIIVYILYVNNSEKNLSELITTVGVLAAVIIKLSPSINKLIISFQNLKYYDPSVNIIVNDLKLSKNINDTSIKKITSKTKELFFREINLKNITFSYANKSRKVLDNVSLTISAGTSTVIIGKSGEGKSTLIDLLLGLRKPTTGQILLDGKQSIDDNLSDWHHKIGYVSQNTFLLDGTIEENIAFGISHDLIDKKKLENAIKNSNLMEVIKDLPQGIKTKTGEAGIKFSGGQRQRISIARALYNEPEILIFDEATNSLDQLSEKKIINTQFFKMNKTIIMITHQLNSIKKFDNIYELKSGKLLKK